MWTLKLIDASVVVVVIVIVIVGRLLYVIVVVCCCLLLSHCYQYHCHYDNSPDHH